LGFSEGPKLEPKLGAMLTDMLITMTDRGPDSAGIAIYGGAGDGLGEDHRAVGQPGGGFCNAGSRP
jgi:glutamate synthase domain-containing protein 1